LINAEGDYLPGLIIDYHNGHAVAQLHANAFEPFLHLIEQALKETLPATESIYFQRIYDDQQLSNSVEGTADSAIIKEHGLKYAVNWVEGQKTGFFLDQRENRLLLRRYVEDKNVLNAYAYSGGFSLNALAGKAASVTSVDVSKAAMAWLDQNLELNGFTENHTSFTGDTYKFLLQHQEAPFDVIILDPPAFAKHFDARHRALKGYQKVNRLAFEKIAPGGTLFTFSCSNVVTKELFEGAVRAAAIEAGREVQVLHHLSQSPDHPVNLMHPEGGYLKGLVLHVR
jgi:23S rRNA (cytosine1962-C5)-methyltransferase